jgi:acyl-CoA-binding protein
MVATADAARTALRDAWKKSKPELRDYTTKYHNAKWEALKAASAKVAEQEPVSA